MNKQGVYFLQSEKNNRYYIGSTKNLDVRLKEHLDGCVNATKHLRPLKLVFFQPYADLKLARSIEFKLKKLKSRIITEQIIKDGFIKMGL